MSVSIENLRLETLPFSKDYSMSIFISVSITEYTTSSTTTTTVTTRSSTTVVLLSVLVFLFTNFHSLVVADFVDYGLLIDT